MTWFPPRFFVHRTTPPNPLLLFLLLHRVLRAHLLLPSYCLELLHPLSSRLTHVALLDFLHLSVCSAGGGHYEEETGNWFEKSKKMQCAAVFPIATLEVEVEKYVYI